MKFLIDESCGFCRRSAKVLLRLAPGIDIVPVGLQHHAIFREAGHDHLGHRAIGQALASAGRTRFLRAAGAVLLWRPLGPFWAWLYRRVAKNRGLISRFKI